MFLLKKGTIGIEIATLSVFAPNRSKTILKYAAKAMIAGNFSAFMNACIAGTPSNKTNIKNLI
jgi:nucleoside permease NupC